ncbi:MAG: hypothetical protein HY922_15755 [Elusimicrobia bacterium]|nr:hypothetical protein [Elusimicrobiota bacterium]
MSLEAPLMPRKIVQKFSKENLDEFRRMSARDRLEWLEEIGMLYWKALLGGVRGPVSDGGRRGLPPKAAASPERRDHLLEKVDVAGIPPATLPARGLAKSRVNGFPTIAADMDAKLTERLDGQQGEPG